METRDYQSGNGRDHALQPTHRDGDVHETRALRPIAYAASAFMDGRVTGGGWLAAAGVDLSEPWISRDTMHRWVDGALSASARRLLGLSGNGVPSPEAVPQTPQGPPWFYGYVLYEGSSEMVDGLIRGNLFDLDEATSANVVLKYIGNPKEPGPTYSMLRNAELKEKDEEDANALDREIKGGVSAEYIRRREQHILRELLGVTRDQLPCIAFFADPPCAPPAVLRIRHDWIGTPAAQRVFCDGLIEFFSAGTELERLVRVSKTSVELTHAFERLINDNFTDFESSGPLHELPASFPKAACIFMKRGKTWFLVYDGMPRSVDDSIGMSYIFHLLQNPGQEIHAAALRSEVAGEGATPILGSAGEVLDMQALREIKDSISEVERDLKEAEANNDLARTGSLQEARELLYAEVGLATGLHGRHRKASRDQERARQSVTAAIRRAQRAIEKEHEALGRHLAAFLNRGEFLSYRPDPAIRWND